jgi:hypothetical protein
MRLWHRLSLSRRVVLPDGPSVKVRNVLPDRNDTAGERQLHDQRASQSDLFDLSGRPDAVLPGDRPAAVGVSSRSIDGLGRVLSRRVIALRQHLRSDRVDLRRRGGELLRPRLCSVADRGLWVGTRAGIPAATAATAAAIAPTVAVPAPSGAGTQQHLRLRQRRHADWPRVRAPTAVAQPASGAGTQQHDPTRAVVAQPASSAPTPADSALSASSGAGTRQHVRLPQRRHAARRQVRDAASALCLG